MPSALIYLAIMLVVIVLWFALLKRPIYEAILLSFLFLLTITNTWGNVFTYIDKALSNKLLYSMISFIAMSILLTKTKIIDDCIAVILSIVGHVTGGAGYAAVVASTFMGALSGSGPGNVMATGALTIPAMKRSGFPAELAANIESNASSMGNMIPPSSNVFLALSAFTIVYPNSDTGIGEIWKIMWGISLWFIAQKLIMVWSFCKYYKVKRIPREELPGLRETLKKGWRGLLLPVIILLPFVLDYFMSGFFTARLGADGAKHLSDSVLLFVSGVASIYTCFMAEDKSVVKLNNIAKVFGDSIKAIAPAVGVCLFGYMIGELFVDLKVAEEMAGVITGWNFGKFFTVLAMCIITCFMGMVLTGTTLISIFGTTFITILAAVGCNPLLAAAMLPCICGVMSGITPPMGLCMYAGITLAESDFSKTFKNNLWWVAAQFILEVVVLMGWLPIIGL